MGTVSTKPEPLHPQYNCTHNTMVVDTMVVDTMGAVAREDRMLKLSIQDWLRSSIDEE